MAGMVSYEVGEVVEIYHPPYIDARKQGTIARIQSIDPNFGIEVLFPNTTIAWIGWEPFACVLEFPQFAIGRIASERFVLMENNSNTPHRTTTIAHPNNTVRPNTTKEGKTPTRATSATIRTTPIATREYVTIGQGWLRAPFVLPHTVPSIASSSSSSSSSSTTNSGVPDVSATRIVQRRGSPPPPLLPPCSRTTTTTTPITPTDSTS